LAARTRQVGRWPLLGETQDSQEKREKTPRTPGTATFYGNFCIFLAKTAVSPPFSGDVRLFFMQCKV
jgi:hypothetical protein